MRNPEVSGPDPIDLNGFGGLVTLLLAGLTPDRVRGLILVDPDPPVRREWERALATLAARRPAADAARLRDLGSSGRWRRDVEAARRTCATCSPSWPGRCHGAR